MKAIEQEIWDYIDGTNDAAEQAETASKIENDPVYKSVYVELLEIQRLMGSMDLDEPSMSFTRNVMEQVALEPAPLTLKTKVNKNIIYGISVFFILSIVALLAYTFATSDFSFSTRDSSAFKFKMNIDLQQYITPTSIHIFLFIDVVLGLIYLDSFLRRKKV